MRSRWLGRLAGAGTLLGIVAIAASWLGRFSPLLDLASLVFVPACLLVSFSCAILVMCAARRSSRLAGLAVAAAALGLPLLESAAPPPRCATQGPRLRVAWINAHHPADPRRIVAWLDRENPRIVGVAEVDMRSQSLRRELERRFPYRQSCLANGHCSTLIYSRERLVAAQGLARGDPERRRALSAVHARLRTNTRHPLELAAVHFSWPVPPGRQSSEIAELEQAFVRPADLVVMGDFNMSPRMAIVNVFAARNALRIVRSPRPTWPADIAGWSLPGLWQIDHLLVGAHWAVAAMRVSPRLGSDHRGYVADLCAVQGPGAPG